MWLTMFTFLLLQQWVPLAGDQREYYACSNLFFAYISKSISDCTRLSTGALFFDIFNVWSIIYSSLHTTESHSICRYLHLFILSGFRYFEPYSTGLWNSCRRTWSLWMLWKNHSLKCRYAFVVPCFSVLTHLHPLSLTSFPSTHSMFLLCWSPIQHLIVPKLFLHFKPPLLRFVICRVCVRYALQANISVFWCETAFWRSRCDSRLQLLYNSVGSCDFKFLFWLLCTDHWCWFQREN